MKPIYTLIKFILLIFFLILAIINTQVVPFFYVPGAQVRWPLIAILFLSFIVGAIFGIFAMFGRLLRLRNENSRLRSEVQKSARLSTQDITAPPPVATSSTETQSTVQ